MVLCVHVVGGPDYYKQTRLRLTIANYTVEDFILFTFQQIKLCKFVVLKLPVNYDNEHLQNSMINNIFNMKLNYELYTNLHKMTLTVISKD